MLAMQGILASRRGKLLLIGSALLVFLGVVFLVVRVMFSGPASPNAVRLQQLEYLQRVLEAYAAQHGAYPEPTARRETPDGMRHVWGYELGKPSLASCTVLLQEDESADAERSHCGGDIYDVNGNVIGWKGTLTAESGLNNIELLRKNDAGGRVLSPLSEITTNIPLDPAYSSTAALATAGFGEYIYAVRMPDDSAENRGAAEYQIALTLQDPDTGNKTTYIRGNYFVPSEERDVYPASLIGPGVLMDAFGNPVAGQTAALQVVVDGQEEGLPHPALGSGEETLERLALERKAYRLQQAIDDRQSILADMPMTDARTALAAALTTIDDALNTLVTSFDSETPPELTTIETRLAEHADSLTSAMQTFITDKQAEVQELFTLLTEHQEDTHRILQSAYEGAVAAEDRVLEARDEVLRYLDGEGIEEQSRNRAARILQEVLDEMPQIDVEFAAAGLAHPMPFLLADVQDALSAIALHEGKTPLEIDSTPITTLATVASELSVHFSDLHQIVNEIQGNLENSTVSSEEIDESLRTLSRAMSTENERLKGLLDGVAPKEEVVPLQTEFLSSDESIPAIARAAAAMDLHGDFTGLVFDPAFLEAVSLQRGPGIPDFDTVENDLAAEYKGIPYPLP